MDEEGGILQGSEDQQQVAPQGQPMDLEGAFRYLNAQNKEMAQGDMGAGKEPEPQAGREQQPQQREPEPATEPAQEPTREPAGQAAGDDAGVAYGAGDSGDAGYTAKADYSDEMAQLRQFISDQAKQTAAKEAREQGVQLISLDQLYQRDERSGVVTFKNLDNPNRPFETRQDAQRWVEAYNQQLVDTFNRRAREYERQIAQQYEPTYRLLQFAPEFDKMSKIEQEIFDDIVEPYGITDANGDLIGYSCNLESAKAQAVKIAKRMPSASNEEQSNVKQPSVRMPKGGSSGSQSAPATEPKNIQEAMKMYHDQIRKGK